MSLYTERHGMRKPVQRTDAITVEMYSLILTCCEKYYDNLAHLFPEQCPDGAGCCGLNQDAFQTMLTFEIPSLFRNSANRITAPQKDSWRDDDEYDQYALLDLIEYIGQNCKDITTESYHSFFGHHHISLRETDGVFDNFRNDINNIFDKTGLSYTLTDQKIVERIIENGVLTPEVEKAVTSISEQGTRDLLREAILLFRDRNPESRKNAVEKIWDALERLKTFYTSLDKKASAQKVVGAMSGGVTEFDTLFNEEFNVLTKIGNNFRIRHHETNKTDITDLKHYDYFFNRCLALIALAIQCVQ